MEGPKCQFENRVGVKFCEECGAKYEIKCPACKAAIPFGRKFCGDCGYALSKSTEAAVSDKEESALQISESPLEDIPPEPISTEGERKELFQEFGMKGFLGQVYFSLGLLYKARKKANMARQCMLDANNIFQECEAGAYLKQVSEALDSLA